MESKYNKLKKILSQEDNQLPPNLDWEQMEDGILKKMAELEEKPVNNYSLKNRFLVAAGLIIAIALIPFLCNRTFNSNGSDNHSLVTNNQSISKSDELQEENLSSNKHIDQSVSTNLESTNSSQNRKISTINTTVNKTENSNANNSKSKKDLAINSTSNALKPNRKNNTFANYANNKIAITHSINTPQKKKNISLTEDTQKSISDKNATSPSIEARSNTQVKNMELETVASLKFSSTFTTLSLKNIYQEIEVKSNYFPILESSSLNFLPPTKKSNELKGRFTLLSGVSAWSPGFGNSKPERDEFEQKTASFNTQLNYVHPFKKNWTVMIGFQYQQLESRFEQNVALENYSVTLTDTVLQIFVNESTGLQEKVYGDTTLMVVATRQVKHHNTSRLYQIPFAVGKTWTKNNWQTDLLIGGSVNVFSQNKGQTLFENELQTYDNSSTEFINNQWKLNAMIAGRLTYQINDYLGITSGLQFQRSLTNWSKEQNTKMNPNVLSLELGLSFRF